MKPLIVAGSMLVNNLSLAAELAHTGQDDIPVLEPYYSLLCELVDINSGTGNSDGCESVRQRLAQHFQALGFVATFSDLPEGHRVMTFDYPGSRRPALVLHGHVDTVFPRTGPTRKSRLERRRLLGDGVLDMKGGLCLMLNVLSEMDAAARQRTRVVIDDDEEIGSPFSRKTTQEACRGVPYCLVYEPGLVNGNLVSSQSGVHWLEITTRGKAAHAGADHAHGVNAIRALSEIVIEASSLTDYIRSLTVNVGVFQGGSRPNVVPDLAKAQVDIRFLSPGDREAVLSRLQEILARPHGLNPVTGESAVVEAKDLVDVPCLTQEHNVKLRQLLGRTLDDLNLKVQTQHLGYSGDANFIGQVGTEVLVGLGPTGEFFHTEREYVDLDSWQPRLHLNVALVKAILTSVP